MASAFTLTRDLKSSPIWSGERPNSEQSHRIFATCSADWTDNLISQDSMDNVEILKRGDVQLTSAGTGIRHSEVCNGNEDAHLVQIWAYPWKESLTPKYFTR
jgi:redox-sensitive bicupin YhaK (pirin superfamily)